MPKRLKRDEYGYILLDEIPYIESNINISKVNKNMHNVCRWILLNNGCKILLKEDYNDLLIPELLIMYFLKSLNISCASYDGAILNDTKYIITPSFLKHNEKIFNPLSNASYLITSYKDCKKYNIGDFYLKTIFADYIYGNADRSKNFGIIKNNNEYKNAILFDNSEVSLERTSDSFPYINNDNSMDFIINYLINYEVIVNWLKTDLKKYNLYSCTNKIEKKKKMYIPSYI